MKKGIDATLRDELMTQRLAIQLDALSGSGTRKERLESADAAVRLASYLASVAAERLERIPEADRVEAGAELANKVLSLLNPEARVLIPPEILTGLIVGGDADAEHLLPQRPMIPLSASDLIVNGAGQPTLGSELRLELQSAESVDLICAFVIWSGVRVLKQQLADLVERGGRLRIVTTTYMGATEPKALEELVRLGADIRIAFDARSTKLHAKSWLIERPNGLTTAFVGSSNLSHTALLDGLEWNVRLAHTDNPSLVSRVRDTFEVHWNDQHFETFDPGRDRDRLRLALGEGERRSVGDRAVSFANLDVNPYPHQRLMLDTLEMERKRHDRHKNLVVAATGTGKTVVAALDFRRLLAARGGDLSLLFVAHRRQILEQARTTYRAVLRDGNFGQLLGDGEEPTSWKHVFAMVQSLGSDQLKHLGSEHFDVIVIDEFHHAAAASYDALLAHFRPKELLGMTATPERMDGQDVTQWFGGRIAVELRLWEAIDQGFLSPFQYFGISDGVDLSDLEWRSGGYAVADLENVYTGNDARVAKLLEAINDVVEDPQAMKALGFCVSVAHAEFMARRFTEAGLESVAISGTSSTDERTSALSRLAAGELRVIFSVDVFGEGVDVPAVDTLLLLRPTQSATVLTQQLGRGLRRAEGKRCLTVLDLIGQQNRRFRFEDRLAAILDRRNGSVRRQAEEGFPFLPPGCEITLDRVSEEVILGNLRESARFGQWGNLVDDLRRLGDVSLGGFLDRTGRGLDDVYRRPEQTWVRMRAEAEVGPALSGDKDERMLLKAIGRMIHSDDRERTSFVRSLLQSDGPPKYAEADPRRQRLLAMFHFSIWGLKRFFSDFDQGYRELWKHPRVLEELGALVVELDARSTTLTRPLGLDPRIPILTQGVYSRDEVMAGFGFGTAEKPPQLREGVRWCEAEQTDLFFVTLNKSEANYSPTTMYRDFAISPEGFFHWESQSTTNERGTVGQRYINHAAEGSSVVIFVRETAKTARGTTSPYACLGRATYVEHRGERPMAITWKLLTPMPEALFESARSVAA